MIIMHFIVNETNNTQVFQGQHLTEHHYKEKKKKKKTSYKTSKRIFSKCSNRIKDRMQILIFIKVVLAKIFQQF